MPVLKDAEGYFGSPTSDSKRGMITEDTRRIMMNIFAFGGKEGLEGFLAFAKDLLLQYAQAADLETGIIQ
ncbi:hypothetical protein SDC9_195095 [bioreactor metagenome]|uniref:Uncharacterized protein n=1 Tax=bioreactor metagenome TaxID=1076179 RepID=A0A645IJJ0_9ZZZZ